MALSTLNPEPDAPLAQINTTPLVDVMLVLLIIFLITIPVVTTSVQVELPKESHLTPAAQAHSLVISVDAAGTLYWFDTPVTAPELAQRLAQQALEGAAPRDIQIRGDAKASYKQIDQVVRAARAAGFGHISFVTQPASP